MIELAYDPASHLLACIASGVRSTAENERLLAAIDELDRGGRADRHPVGFLLELANGSSPPDAHWRRRFAEQRQAMKAPRVFTAIVTTSTLLRGVLTAMNWISPPPVHVKSVHHATREEAEAWLELVQGTRIAIIRRLFARLSLPHARAR
jgi:hypothetical protein